MYAFSRMNICEFGFHVTEVWSLWSNSHESASIRVTDLCRAGDKQLPLIHIFVNRPQWVKLIYWRRGRHRCVNNLTIIGSDNGLSPGRRQALIWTNTGILLIWLLGTNPNETLIDFHTYSFTKMHLKMSSKNWRPFCLSLNVLTYFSPDQGDVEIAVGNLFL